MNETDSIPGVHPHRAIWAKQSGLTGTYPLAAHLLDTATIAGALYDLWLRPGLRALIDEALGAHARSVVQWMTGTHDVGKASPVFQYQPHNKDENWTSIRRNILDNESVSFGDLRTELRWAENSVHRRHERISALTLAGDSSTMRSPLAPAADCWLALPALGHHGRFTLPLGMDPDSVREFDLMTNKMGWGHVRQDLLDLVSAGCGISSTDLSERVSPVVTVLLSGLTVLADRIASGTEWVVRGTEMVKAGQISLDRPREWIQVRGLEAPARLESTVGIYHDWGSSDAAQHAILHDYSPRPLQEAARTTGGGLWIAMAPTGVGKTEAALLRHSTRAERLLFLLPTQATTNAMMARVQEAFQGTHNVGALAHGMARTTSFYQQAVTTASAQSAGRQDGTSINDDGGLYPTEFVRSGSSRLLAPVCVATVDQALFAALPAKWTHLRLLALANAHVVVDEAHTLDQYQSQLFTDLLTWLGATGTRVTVLTATLPSRQRRAFTEAYANHEPEVPTEFPSAEEVPPRGLDALPLPTDPPSHATVPANPRTIDLQHEDDHPINEMVAGHVAWIRQMRKEYPHARIGLICNTVARAQQVAAEFPEALVLHSRMTAAHRNRNAAQLEAQLGKNGHSDGTLVIGTQVIEASLDIDLDLLRTELCPAPSLIQRVGRSWRREDPKRAERVPGLARPVLSVAAIDSTSTTGWETKPYFRAELKRVKKWLAEHTTLRVPEDCQHFIDGCSATLDVFGEIGDDELDELADNSRKAIRGETHRIDLAGLLNDSIAELRDFMALTHEDLDEETSTRLIDDPATPAILCGDPDVIPGAWDGDPEALQRVAGRDQETVVRALEGSINIPQRIAGAISDVIALDASPSLLSRYKVVPNAEYLYDPRLGLIDPTTERETS